MVLILLKYATLLDILMNLWLDDLGHKERRIRKLHLLKLDIYLDGISEMLFIGTIVDSTI